MGTAVNNLENDEGVFNETVNLTANTSFAASEENGNSILYKLVRVEGNGRLVPATDDEIMEVKDLLEDETTDLINKTDTGQNSECFSDEGISSGLLQVQSSEGLLQSKDREGAEEIFSPLKSLEERLQTTKSEEKICFTYGPPDPSAFVKDNIQWSDQNDKVPSEMELQSKIPSFVRNLVGECLNGADSSKEDVSPSCDWISSLKPDFSRLKTEICLDNLTIRELHKIFRATFGRETTVKDKQWLKRRIAMGLPDMPNTSFMIDNKLVKGVDKICNDVGGSFTKETTSEETADDKSKHSSIALFNQDGSQSDSDTCPGGIFRDYERRRGDFDTEQSAEKRVRKSTRRYIEELSETELKHPSGRSIASLKDRRLAPKSQLRSFKRVSPGGRIVITRTVSLAGSSFQVPCVSQVRISRPRENMKALMSQEIPWGSVRGAIKPTSQRVQHEMARGGFRRKHHRAWTLSEVMKLVEGVSKYGAGKWSVIKRLYFPSYSYRTAVDLKDKWRNLLKATYAQTPSDKVIMQGNLRKHSSVPLPAPILFRVRELAEKQQEQLAPNSLLNQDSVATS